jgi:hypothetical protein
MGYVCKTKCFHRGKLFKKGDTYVPSPEELKEDSDGKNKVPKHFVSLKDGEVLPEEPTPRLGTKLGRRKENPSMKAPSKDVYKLAE